MTWSGADEYCRSQGGHLAVISDETENERFITWRRHYWYVHVCLALGLLGFDYKGAALNTLKSTSHLKNILFQDQLSGNILY